MLAIKYTGIDGLGQIKSTMSQWWVRLVSGVEAQVRNDGAWDLDPQIRYDVGLSDRRPMVSKSGGMPQDPAFKAAIRIGRF